MNYTTLVASKGTVGSIANWVNYSKVVDILPTILEEAQALIYQVMRVREMEASLRFTLTEGMSCFALPSRFLDPNGDIKVMSQNVEFDYLPPSKLRGMRSFSEEEGDLGNNPFTTTSGSSLVAAVLAGHDFSQDSTIYFTGATAVGGLTLNGTYEITSISSGAFVIDAGDAATSSATGGGSAIEYVCQNLNQGSPIAWALIDSKIRFDCAFNDRAMAMLPYFQSLPILSSSNPTNFLTDRYPHIVRTACLASAADFMKDDAEYQKASARMGQLIMDAQVHDDLRYRGSSIMTETPGHAR